MNFTKRIFFVLAMAAALSCAKQEGPVFTDKEAAEEVETPSAAASLCKDEHLGQRPMIIAYLTEYTKANTLDATSLTHINYAHGRFKNPKTGDGGIVISGASDLLPKVMDLKKKVPTLKVLLMIGGWGEHADGFSMMARDPEKRALFCAECKKHIDNYGFDGIDIDWEYPGGGPSTNGKHKDDEKNEEAAAE